MGVSAGIPEPLLDLPNVTRSTMMGLPCLRVDGAFFASWDRNTGALLVKLPAARVDELVAAGRAEPFAPIGPGRQRLPAPCGMGPNAQPALPGKSDCASDALSA